MKQRDSAKTFARSGLVGAGFTANCQIYLPPFAMQSTPSKSLSATAAMDGVRDKLESQAAQLIALDSHAALTRAHVAFLQDAVSAQAYDLALPVVSRPVTSLAAGTTPRDAALYHYLVGVVLLSAKAWAPAASAFRTVRARSARVERRRWRCRRTLPGVP
jgi:hypothetical protein